MPDNQYLAKYQPCVSLDCNSSDGLSVYADDGHAYCFVCETHWTAGQYAIAKMEKQEENGGDDLSFISKPSKPSKPSRMEIHKRVRPPPLLPVFMSVVHVANDPKVLPKMIPG